MKNILYTLAFLICPLLSACAEQTVPASDGRITVMGRHSVSEDTVRFDWSGVRLTVCFKGTALSMKASDTKADWFNVWVDKAPVAAEDFRMHISADSTYTVISGLGRGLHTVVLQKRTEGEQGCVSVSAFSCDGTFLAAPSPSERCIEFIGDSYTCGFGTESAGRDDPFLPETENCNLTYAEIAARYFGADAVHVSHSGIGLVRNYGGAVRPTMPERYGHVFDEAGDEPWDFTGYQPDIAVVYLGTNDFSCGEHPEYTEWKAGTDGLVSQIRAAYGEDIPVLFVASKASDVLGDFVRKATEGLPNVHWASIQEDAHNSDSDLGACWHPNYEGHRKVASIMIPYISTLTGWELSHAAYE